ncbi:MAG: class I SAM-dependent methyltransferase [Bacteroidales bacterium]|jgi:2-polyprenyl-3-methyl-5-hydroxy-6-metoxy-1,4-benzoquinol methylase
MENTNYYNRSSREEMLKYIPENAVKILEVGCGEGLFLRYIKENRNAETWGIEMNNPAAENASRVADKVITGDFNLVYKDLPSNYFDCIVFNDVIEHLSNPWLTLKNTKLLLSKNGVVVSSIPNFRFIGNLTEIITKADFKYKEEGILDKTHLRFFTSKSLYRLFEECGYELICQEGLRPCKSWKEKLFIFLSFGFFKDMRYKQFANVARVKI